MARVKAAHAAMARAEVLVIALFPDVSPARLCLVPGRRVRAVPWRLRLRAGLAAWSHGPDVRPAGRGSAT